MGGRGRFSQVAWTRRPQSVAAFDTHQGGISMSRHGICLFLCGLAVGATYAEARATVFVSDPFAYSDGNLAGQTPSPGPGAAWNAGSATGVNPIQVTNGEAVVRQISTINSED